MPPRKSNASSEATMSSDSRRTSLRRLSSIASLQNFFTRRRSQHLPDQHAVTSSSSDLSASSSTVDTTLKASGSISTANLFNNEQDGRAELPAAPAPTHPSTRRSSYICLPDDPIGGMPRSRTFSNLPVPARSKKPPTAMGSSKSHARLPSAFLPNTRLPSPPTSTRKHSHSRLVSAYARGPPPARNRMERSDTEPLLRFEGGDSGSHLPRPTAFKENISLSPIKPQPALEMSYKDKHHYSSSPLHAGQYQPPGAWVSSSSDVGHSLSSSVPSTASYSPSPPPPISKYASHPAVQMVRDYKSSPIRPLYRSSRDRPPTPGASSLNPLAQMAPAQRWNSQPVLTSRQNNRENTKRKDSKHQIKQTRLMSARQAPTPQPPKTPLVGHTTAAPATKVKGANNSASAGHVRQTSEHTPTQITAASETTSLSQVTTYEPPAYWAGRLSALVDRNRNEELSLTAPSLTPKAQTDKLHTAEASTARLKRVLQDLHNRCATTEARDSLFAFQTQFASMMNLAELRPPKVVLHLGDSLQGEDKAEGGMSENRKASFMDRLLGRGQKRRSLVLA